MVITRESLVDDALNAHPGLARIFIQQGMPCPICGESFWGTVEDLARQYGRDVDAVVDALNESR